MDLVKDTEEDMENWYKITLYRLIEICKTTASKYTRSKVRKALPTDYAYVIEELITEKAEVLDKEAYYDSIVNTIIEIGSAENFIIALAELIQRLVVDHLHILGHIDSVSILKNIQISVTDTVSYHCCNTGFLSCCRTHPDNIMVSPLNIQGVILHQAIHNEMWSRTSVINIPQNM